MHAPEDREGGHGDDGCGNSCGREDMLHLPPRIKEDGRHHEEIETRIERAPEGSANGKSRPSQMPPAEIEDEKKKQRHKAGVQI